jgi:hypothetical protein
VISSSESRFFEKSGRKWNPNEILENSNLSLFIFSKRMRKVILDYFVQDDENEWQVFSKLRSVDYTFNRAGYT